MDSAADNNVGSDADFRKIVISIMLAVVLSASQAFPLFPAYSQVSYDKVTVVERFKSYDLAGCSDQVNHFKFLSRPPVKWSSSIDYVIYTANSGLGASDVASAVFSGSTTWDSSTSTALVGFVAYAFPEIFPPLSTLDFMNTVTWQNLSTLGFSSDTVAVTNVWFNTSTREIVDFDIMLNTLFNWSNSGASNKLDVQNVATNMFGNAIGLGQVNGSNDCALTMYRYTNYAETAKQTLGAGDITALQKLYGT